MLRERLSVQPSVGFYNLLNFANFDLPSASLNGLLTGAAGQINGTTPTGHNIDRVGIGTGVHSLGAPRLSLSKSSKCLSGRDLYFFHNLSSDAHFSHDSPRHSTFSLPLARGPGTRELGSAPSN